MRLHQTTRVGTRSAPERDDGGEGHRRGEVSRELVVAGRHAPEVLQAAKGGLDAPAFLVAPLVVLDRALAGAPARDDGRGAIRLQVAAEVVGIVAPVSDEPLQATWCCSEDLGRNLHVRGVAGREVDDGWSPEDVGEDVDLGGLAAARGADGLRLRPPLPPCAERCALT